MKQKTQEYVQFIKENHKDFSGHMPSVAVSRALGISQGRVSQLVKEIKSQNKVLDEIASIGQEFGNQEAAASTAEA